MILIFQSAINTIAYAIKDITYIIIYLLLHTYWTHSSWDQLPFEVVTLNISKLESYLNKTITDYLFAGTLHGT